MQQKIEMLLSRLEGVRGSKGRYQAKCPAHDDRLPSLAITEAGDKVLIHCFAGCSPVEILDAVGLELGDLFEGSLKNGNGHHHVINWHNRVKRARYALSLIAVYAGQIEENWDALATELALDESDQAMFWGAFRDVRKLLDG